MRFVWLLLTLWQLDVNDADVLHRRVARQVEPACLSPAQEGGLCVSIRECKSLFTMMVEDGKDPFIISFLRKSKCAGGDKKNPTVCCPDALHAQRQLVSETSTESTTAAREESSTAKANTRPPANTAAIKCGESALQSDRVVGGKDAALGNWPWMVGLSYKIRSTQNAPTNIKCGATLISSQWVITAAHCLKGPALKDLELDFARLGDLDLDEKVNDGANPVDASVDQIIVHSQYSTDIKQNDIALLHLKEPVVFTKNLHPICLLSGPTYKEDKYYATKLPYIVGWGDTGWRGKPSSKLQEAQVKIVPPTKCAEQYAKVRGALINEKVLCAGDRGKDTCQGDSGGPLIFIGGKTFFLGGIVSYGIGCNTSIPGVYTKIAEYIDWINENTGESF